MDEREIDNKSGARSLRASKCRASATKRLRHHFDIAQCGSQPAYFKSVTVAKSKCRLISTALF